jgi:hypothetical protein
VLPLVDSRLINYLRGDLDTVVYSTADTSRKAFLVRSLSEGAILIYPDTRELVFLPKDKIHSFSSLAKANRIFDRKYLWRS